MLFPLGTLLLLRSGVRTSVRYPFQIHKNLMQIHKNLLKNYLNPGQSYQYVSGCPLVTEMGTMEGFYTMKYIENDKEFVVQVPRFQMIAPFKNN